MNSVEAADRDRGLHHPSSFMILAKANVTSGVTRMYPKSGIATIQRQKEAAIKTNVFASPRPNKETGVGNLSCDTAKVVLKMKTHRPMKKGYKPVPGLLKVPNPYPREMMQMIMPNAAKMRTMAVSSENFLPFSISPPVIRSFQPSPETVGRIGLLSLDGVG
jgi:hypothetical protein